MWLRIWSTLKLRGILNFAIYYLIKYYHYYCHHYHYTNILLLIVILLPYRIYNLKNKLLYTYELLKDHSL